MMKLGHIARFAAVGALALGGVAVGTGSASADVQNFGCRSDHTKPSGQLADVGYGVHLDSCAEDLWGGSGNGIYARVAVQVDPGGLGVYPCAQLWKLDGFGGMTEVHNNGCMGNWYGGPNGTSYTEWDTAGQNGMPYDYVQPGGGAYVVRVGFWATINGHYGYYGDVESPVTSVY
ncbi:hypothetical protein AB5J72_01815 [Streptomyces sp. CG1]|uniref:hypothetical protein n=1 Tax=Streptomyces sp. CG1 TaxID=1287523 RepID=UPI0034E2CC80